MTTSEQPAPRRFGPRPMNTYEHYEAEIRQLEAALAERDAECAAWLAYWQHYLLCDECAPCGTGDDLITKALARSAAVAPAARETQETTDG